MDRLDELFIAAALSGLMSHANDDPDRIASVAVMVGRKTASAARLAAEEEATAPEAKPAKKRG
jgi:hypothetical protein